ncbi:MAG: TIGR00282 family metallophosphoesterase, partial [Candidatus Gracilibacteria bacterium]|nr:TIGR00282 family metallophosphoesterase [Candidatus Gracilibacteria bacterium]
MKILIFGDIFGRTGRRMVADNIGALRDKYNPDFIIGNSENITAGKGPTAKHVQTMQDLGFDVLTGGNHMFSNLKAGEDLFNNPDSIQIRPANYFAHPDYRVPGRGYRIVEKDGQRILVINIMSGVFMREGLDNPFLSIDRILKGFEKETFDAIVVDFHRETTAELANMAHFLDGRVSVVYGTHTHIQTNDDRISQNGTGMITDVGMTGPLESSIGHTFESRLPLLVTRLPIFGPRPEQVIGRGILTGLVVEVKNGKCVM